MSKVDFFLGKKFSPIGASILADSGTEQFAKSIIRLLSKENRAPKDLYLLLFCRNETNFIGSK